MNDVWLSEEHPISTRRAIVADEIDSVWLYLTGPGGKPIEVDCWLWNRGPALDRAAWQTHAARARARGGPPPAPKDVLRPDAVQGRTAVAATLRLQWNAVGDAVSAWDDRRLLGTVHAGERRGQSAGLAVECPWGRPLADG
jgi:hypothetical protein